MAVDLQTVEERSHVGDGEDLRITLNKRLATAAAAIVHRMINRSRPLVFRPVLPFKKGSKTSTAMSEFVVQCLG